MHPQWIIDGAVDVVPVDIDNTFAYVCQLSESVLEQIKVIVTAARALVNNLGIFSLKSHGRTHHIIPLP